MKRDEFTQVLQEHMTRYPLMEPQDFGKLIYQGEFGPEHLIQSPEQVLGYIRAERSLLPAPAETKEAEWIGNRMCRFPLENLKDAGDEELLAKLFYLTARECTGTEKGLSAKMDRLDGWGNEGLSRWLSDYRAKGCPPVGHSEAFRKAYRPHYRLLKEEYASYFPVLSAVWHLLSEKEAAVISIDGRCGSGKTMLSELLARVFICNVFHIDDFYLPLAQRVSDWTERPCANMDLDRFLREAVLPAKEGKTVTYRPYSCQRGEYLPAMMMPHRPLTVVEGSYSQHPSLAGSYDMNIFLTCRKDEQRRRLEAREGEYFSVFENRWIPLEEGYLSRYAIEEKATIQVDTSAFFLHETE